MAFSFRRSSTVLGKLSRDVTRTPPPEADHPLDYVDQSLLILGQAIQGQNTRLEQEFLSQRQFIAAEFRLQDERINKRMDERDQRIDTQLREFKQSMDERFQHVDERFQHVDGRFCDLEECMEKGFDDVNGTIRGLQVQLENSTATARNGRLRRMHQPINLIKVLKPVPNTKHFEWTTPGSMPKHIKGVYNLGQHAQGNFEGTWEGKTKQEKSETKRKALDTIRDLAAFYQVTVMSDEASESDATEVILEDFSVDQYMELLLDEWGMDWQKVCKMGKQVHSQTQQVTVKRTGDTSIRGSKPMKQSRSTND